MTGFLHNRQPSPLNIDTMWSICSGKKDYNASSSAIIASLCQALISKKGSGFQQEEDTNLRRTALTPSHPHDLIIFW